MAIAAAEPAPAAVITWARGSTTLPAAQTPGLLVRPVASTTTNPAFVTSQPSARSRPSAWDVARPDEDRGPLDHFVAVDLDAGQPVGLDHQLRHLAAHDPHTSRVQLTALLAGQAVRVGEEEDVVRPLAYEQGVLHRAGQGAQHPEGLVAHLPPVAVRAVEEIPTPALVHPGDVRELIGHACGEEHPSCPQPTAAGEVHEEAGFDALDPIAHQLHAVAGRLGPPGDEQVRRGHPFPGQEALHVGGRGVSGRSGVDHRHPAACPAQHQGGAQAGRSPADHHHVVRLHGVHAESRNGGYRSVTKAKA